MPNLYLFGLIFLGVNLALILGFPVLTFWYAEKHYGKAAARRVGFAAFVLALIVAYALEIRHPPGPPAGSVSVSTRPQ